MLGYPFVPLKIKSNYTLKDEDIQYEVAQGYIIKIDGKFYYYPKKA